MNFLKFLTESLPIIATGSGSESASEQAYSATEAIASATEAVAAEGAKLGFNPMNFITNLKYMGIGMLTIFIIIGVIILSTMLINKVFSAKQED